MSAEEIISIAYPSLALFFFMRGCLCVIYFKTVERSRFFLSIASICFIQAATLGTFTVFDANSIVYHSKQLQDLSNIFFVMLFASSLWSNYELFRLTSNRGTKGNKEAEETYLKKEPTIPVLVGLMRNDIANQEVSLTEMEKLGREQEEKKEG